MSTSDKVVAPDFSSPAYRVNKEKPCPVCHKPDWCLSDWSTWAICQRVASECRWQDAGWFHRVGDTLGRGNGNAAPVQRPASTPKPKGGKLWPDLVTAEREFGELPLARDDLDAQEFLKANHGLLADWLPRSVRVLVDHGRKYVVYAGQDSKGQTRAFKAKGLFRNADGKRPCLFLHGSGGALLLPSENPDVALVVVMGEEKALAAWAAGFHVLSPLIGERELDPEWIAYLRENPREVILANDNDPVGEGANAKTGATLDAAGYAQTIRVVIWPDEYTEKADLNDVLKQSGLDGLRSFLESARPYESRLPRCLSAADFLAVPRPPLVFHIENLLPYGGKMTFSATSKFGKSMFAIQTGFALAAGDCTWLGWKFGPPCRVLYFQAEIMDALLAARLEAILRSMPPQLDYERASRNFLIQETGQRRPNLYSNTGRACAEALIERHNPDVLILDPLAALCPGMEENAAESMGLALDYFSNLAARHNCAVMLVHHHGKSGVSRGSSVFEAWPESDLQAVYLSADDDSIAKVAMRLRCAFNPGPVYWRMPSEDSLWFERMPEGWAPEVEKRKKKAEAKHVPLALRASGEKFICWRGLVNGVKELTNCGQRTAENVVKEAKELGLVRYENAFYSLPS